MSEQDEKSVSLELTLSLYAGAEHFRHVGAGIEGERQLQADALLVLLTHLRSPSVPRHALAGMSSRQVSKKPARCHATEAMSFWQSSTICASRRPEPAAMVQPV
ncbi:hypothetical protein, partial [Bacillus pacificus]|uniref:hypothetical protein n=1 Tax=Bacillus pacificus TaxID=2026187 RepID=UPI0028527919